MINSRPVNYFMAKNGKVAAVCECCGKKSKYVSPSYDGQPCIWLCAGWSHAPFPKDFIHKDGSTGSRYDCPSCEKRLRAGESLKLRSYLPNIKRDGTKK
ncbi:hypothetical protein [Acinetobacter guerrae]|uniref:hypothetical protein n=1 Tax=Acinetobacter guerrae TaxID=1843371 RepID=UPI00128E4F01|nr:hypothetical protein [Acinetobacter guerrae]